MVHFLFLAETSASEDLSADRSKLFAARILPLENDSLGISSSEVALLGAAHRILGYGIVSFADAFEIIARAKQTVLMRSETNKVPVEAINRFVVRDSTMVRSVGYLFISITGSLQERLNKGSYRTI